MANEEIKKEEAKEENTKKKKNKKEKIKKEKVERKHLIPPKHFFYYVCSIGVLVIIIVYFFPFRAVIQKTEAINRENEELRLKIIVWKEYYANKDTYLENTEQILAEINDAYDTYPSDVKEEDGVMLAVNMTKDTDIVINNVNLSGPSSIYEIPEEEVLPVNIEDFTGKLEWYEKKVTYVVEGDYDTIKDSIKKIYDEKNNITINGITLSKAEESLVGNIDVSFYSLRGTEKLYQKPDISKYVNGTDNIFGITYGNDKEVEDDQEANKK